MVTSLRSVLSGLALAATFFSAGVATAEAVKMYQVTGPVLEVTDSSISVAKGKEKWQLARDKDTKITGDLKVGAKVTIEYRMIATTVEAKGDGKAKADAKAGGDKAGDKVGETKTPAASSDKPAKP